MPSGTRPSGRRREPAHGLVPVNVRTHRASRTPSIQEQVGHAYASTTAIYTAVSNDFKNRMVAQALRRVYDPRSGGDGR
jgi:integrase